MSFHVPHKYRIRSGPHASDDSYGNNGAFGFIVKSSKSRKPLYVIASDGEGWEHVSVSLPDRTPIWEEMSIIKKLFWDDEDLVVQFHPPRSKYVNNHPYVLHMWRKKDTNEFCETPDLLLV